MLLQTSIVLSGSLYILWRRFSENEQRRNPIDPPQQFGVGMLALLCAASSIACLGVVFLSHGAWDMAALAAWPMTAVAALGLGHAARRHPAGRWAFGVTAIWVGLFFAAAIIMTVIRGLGH